jgi:hypothetical protein
MRNIIKRSSVLALVFLGLCAGSARAEEIVVKVPFPFMVHGQTLPAGEYVVQRLDQDPSAMLIRGKNLHDESTAIVMTGPAASQDPAGDKPALTFTRHENQYRLSTIWKSRTDGRVLWGS